MKTHRFAAIASLLLAVVAVPTLAAPSDGFEQGSTYVDSASLATIHQETSRTVASESRVSMQDFERSFDMSVIAKVRCTRKSISQHQRADGSTVEAASLGFSAVQATDGKDYKQQLEENKIFGEYTPSLDISTYIVNPGAHEQFEVEEEYYLTFERAPTREHGATRIAQAGPSESPSSS